MNRPTQAQRELAEKLGLDVPQGVTKSALSRLIDGAIAAERCAKNPDLPTEIAQAGIPTTGVYRRQKIERARQSGIRVGSMVKLNNGVSAVALGHTVADVLALFVINVKNRHIYSMDIDHLTLAYNPPATHLHPLSSFPPPGREPHNRSQWQLHLPQLLAFVEFAEPLIAADQTFRNEFGTFWSALAIADLRQRFTNVQAQLPAPAPEPETNPYRFCLFCGKRQHLRQLNMRCLCSEHSLKHVGADRFCTLCGVPFTKAKGRGYSHITCPACRAGNGSAT